MLDAMQPSPAPAAARHQALSAWAAVAVGSGAAIATAIWLGLPALPAAGLAAAAWWVALTGPMRWAPLLPLLILPGPIVHVPPHEIGLAALCATMILLGLQTRAPWLTRVHAIEVAAGLLLAWGIFTGLWCDDKLWFLFNVRKMAVGLASLWVASRLATRIPRADMLLGITLTGFSIACMTVAHAISLGWPASSQTVSRTVLTDIGWGSSNYIAAILVLVAPSALCVALRDLRPVGRALGWGMLPLAALVASIAGSRGGAILIVLMTAIVVGGARLSRRQLGLAVPLMIALLVIGPGAALLYTRFTNPLEFASVAIRIHYFGIGWRRLVDNLPWGMGLGQELLYRDELMGGDPHNYLLAMGSELGLPGLLLWGAALFAIWRRGGRQAPAPANGFEGIALRVTLVIAVLNSLFEPTFFGPSYHFLFYWIVGSYLGPTVAERVAR